MSFPSKVLVSYEHTFLTMLFTSEVLVSFEVGVLFYSQLYPFKPINFIYVLSMSCTPIREG